MWCFSFIKCYYELNGYNWQSEYGDPVPFLVLDGASSNANGEPPSATASSFSLNRYFGFEVFLLVVVVALTPKCSHVVFCLTRRT